MKTALTLLALAVTLSLSAQQQMTNGSFENWSVNSNTGIFEPNGWYSLNIITQDTVNFGTKRTTDAYDGQYALHLTSGDVDATPYGFPLHDTTAQAVIGTFTTEPHDGMPYTDRPAKLTFYYKYTPGTTPSNVVDTGLLYLKFSGPSGNIGEGIFRFYGNAVTNYTLVEIPITWWYSDTPDSLFLNISSSTTGFNELPQYANPDITNQLNSELFIDKLEFSNFPVGNNTHLISSDFNIYPNPSNGNFYILRKNKSAINTEISIYNAVGTQILNRKTSSNQINVNLPNGIYFLKIDGSNEIKKLVIAR